MFFFWLKLKVKLGKPVISQYRWLDRITKKAYWNWKSTEKS